MSASTSDMPYPMKVERVRITETVDGCSVQAQLDDGPALDLVHAAFR